MSANLAAAQVRQRQLQQACAELERRVRPGEPCCPEDLPAAQPALTAFPEDALELIYTEFVVRRQLGQRPSPAAWCARFPLWQEDLRQLFEIDQIAANTTGPGNPAPVDTVRDHEQGGP